VPKTALSAALLELPTNQYRGEALMDAAFSHPDRASGGGARAAAFR
jgi:hypothetical protein